MSISACYHMVEEQMISELLKMSSDEVFDTVEELQETDESVADIGKLWEGLHFLLTNTIIDDVPEGNPLSEAVIGVDIFCDDEDADFITYISKERVPAILDELKHFDIESAIEGLQPNEFQENEIYPDIWIKWDKEDLQEELNECFSSLLEFYESAAELGKAVVVSIY